MPHMSGRTFAGLVAWFESGVAYEGVDSHHTDFSKRKIRCTWCGIESGYYASPSRHEENCIVEELENWMQHIAPVRRTTHGWAQWPPGEEE